MNTDRELLELAAKAAGLTIVGSIPSILHDDDWLETTDNGPDMFWNPLQNDGDALRLAVKLRIMLNREINCGYDIVEAIGPERDDMTCHCSTESIEGDPYAATRRAIVRAAAEIGRSLK